MVTLMDWPLSPKSPKTPKVPANDDETLALQLQNLLDEWCYQAMESSFAKTWTRRRVLGSVLDVLGHFGLPFTKISKEELLTLPEDEMVRKLVAVMPPDMRNCFETISSELKEMLASQCRMRNALESTEDAMLKEILDDSNMSVVTQMILKEAVVNASAQVAKTQKVHFTWRQSTERRIDRLMCAAENAEHAHQQLLAVEAQLASFGIGMNVKSRRTLLTLVEGSSKTLVHTAFSSWKGVVEQVVMEAETRKKFEKQIQDTEAALLEFQGRQLNNVRGLLLGFAAQTEHDTLKAVFRRWHQDVEERQKDGTHSAKMGEAQKRLKELKRGQVINARQMLLRFAADSGQGLMNCCFQAWIRSSQEYKKEQDMEDAVKKAEAKVKAHLLSRKDDAQKILDRLASESEAGLLFTVLQNWLNHVAEEKRVEELHAKLTSSKSTFANLNARQSLTVREIQGRTNAQVRLNLCLQMFSYWKLEVAVAKAHNNFGTKMENKRRQLQGVNTLFKTFAQKLEEKVDVELERGDTTCREVYEKPQRKSHKHRGMTRSEGTVSLPDIHGSRLPEISIPRRMLG